MSAWQSGSGTPVTSSREVTAGRPPKFVNLAFALYLLNIAMGLISVILLLTSNVWRIAERAAQTDVTGDRAAAVHDAVVREQVTSIVAALVVVALYVLVTSKMRAGRLWARTVLTVVSAFSILNAIKSHSFRIDGRSYTVGGSQIVAYFGLVISVAAVTSMYCRSSNAYFRRKRQVSSES